MPHHLRLPLSVTATGQLATIEQDSSEDIAQSVGLLLTTRPGERASVPGYGTPEVLFTSRPDFTAAAQAVTEWEPRAAPLMVATTTTASQSATQSILTDALHPGFYLADGTLVAVDPIHGGFFLVDATVAAPDPDDVGFYDPVTAFQDLPGTAREVTIHAGGQR